MVQNQNVVIAGNNNLTKTNNLLEIVTGSVKGYKGTRVLTVSGNNSETYNSTKYVTIKWK